MARVKAYPNPLRGAGSIVFDYLPLEASLRIYTLAGELVREYKGNATSQIIWDCKNEHGSGVSSGVYVYRLEAGKESKKGKVCIIR